MLDGVHAVLQGHPDALGGLHMGGHGIAQAVGPVADGLHHLRRHLQLAGDALGLGVHDAAGDHQLDEVHALLPGPVHLPEGLWDALRRHGDGARHVAAGDGDALVGGQDPGTRPLSGGDLVPEAGIKVPQSAHGTDGGDAAHDLQPGKARHHTVGRRPGKAGAHQAADQLLVVPPLLLGLSVARQVDVEIDEARHQVLPSQVHGLKALRNGLLRGDAHDGLPVRQDGQAVPGQHVPGAVQQVGVAIGVFHGFPLLSPRMRRFSRWD